MIEQNIFRIVSAADKEMAHSSMIRFLISKNPTEFLLHFCDEKSSLEKLDVPLRWCLEVTRKIEKKTVRFDIASFHESEGVDVCSNAFPVMVIENKFNSIPTKSQLESYDYYLDSQGKRNCLKILMVFLTEQVGGSLKEYIRDNQWIVIPYISLEYGSERQPAVLEKSLLSYLAEESDKNQHQPMSNENWIRNSYKEYLDGFSYGINSIVNKQGFPKYNQKVNDRFLHMQYLLYVQKRIVGEINELMAGSSFIMEDLNIENNGSRNTVPSVAIWFRTQKNFRHDLVPYVFTAIDGMTPKIGLVYYKMNDGVTPFLELLSERINQVCIRDLIALKPKNRKPIIKDKTSKGDKDVPVCSLFTFQIPEENSLEHLIKDISKMTVSYFNLIRDWGRNDSGS